MFDLFKRNDEPEELQRQALVDQIVASYQDSDPRSVATFDRLTTQYQVRFPNAWEQLREKLGL